MVEGFKHTEAGLIPNDWDDKPLGTISNSIASGKSNTQSVIGGKFPIYGSTGIIGLCLNPDYEGERILIARVGANAGTVNQVGGEYSVSDNTLMVQLKKDVDFNYVFYFLKYSNLNKLIFGSGQPLITGTQLRNLFVFLPHTKTEQTTIATALNDTDVHINQLEQLLKKKRNIKIGVMQELLKPNEGWEVKKLGDFLSYEQPTKYIVTDTEYNDHNQTPVLTAGKSFILGYTNEEFGVFKNFPVIIFDDFTTATKYVDFEFKVKSSAMKILKPKPDANLRFVFELMQTIKFDSTDHKRYWISEYQNIEVKVPNSDEQKRIAMILGDMENEIQELEKQLDKYSMLKQGMMQVLLTGKIRLI